MKAERILFHVRRGVGLLAAVFLLQASAGRADGKPVPPDCTEANAGVFPDCGPQKVKTGLIAERPAIIPEVEIKQKDLLQGGYPFRQVLESGRHFFTTPFTAADGHGEGGAKCSDGSRLEGPRMRDLRDNLAKLANDLHTSPSDLETKLKLPMPIKIPESRHLDFLRLNGLDSQSCFECHNSIGSDNLSDIHHSSHGLARKVSVTAGPAGFASTAFINPTGRQPEPCATPACPPSPLPPIINGEEGFPYHPFKIVRNPPHVFGTGYAQELAEEMTNELLEQKREVMHQAFRDKGVRKTIADLRVEGARPSRPISFGKYAVTYHGPSDCPEDQTVNFWLGRPHIVENGMQVLNDNSPFEEDYSGVSGVSDDFVVRPFQWKGIASNERNFVNDALNFHFGMLSVEKQTQQACVGEVDHDGDKDGIKDELSVGNVSALTIFTMSVRPPTRQVPRDEAARKRVEKGIDLFLKGPVPNSQDFVETPNHPPQATSCAACHIPTMRIYSTTASAENPCLEAGASSAAHTPAAGVDQTAVPAVARIRANNASLSSQRASSADLPVFQRFMRRPKPKAPTPSGYRPMDINRLDLSATAACDGLCFDLTTLEQVPPGQGSPAFKQPIPSDSLSITQPRLAQNPPFKDEKGHVLQTIDVPLFSDLRRHEMGTELADLFEQETDVLGIFVPKPQFLTRPLWGVADTAPFLHDGRALSLEDAIKLHGSSGSEAEQLIKKLTEDQLGDIIRFLLTLRLPHDPRYAFDRSAHNDEIETNAPLSGTTAPHGP